MGRGGLEALPLRVSFRRGAEPNEWWVGMSVGSHAVRQGGGVANHHHTYRGDDQASSFYAPLIAETGVPVWFGAVTGQPALRLGVLLIAEANTRTARTGLWHLRAGVTVPSPAWTACLDYGRSGLVAHEDS
jgi:hypothetical protein